MAGQIEYWTKLGEIVEENPELPFSLIQDILLGREQNELPRSKLRGINTTCSVLLLAASRGELNPKMD